MSSLVAKDYMFYLMRLSPLKFLDYMSFDLGADILDYLNTLAESGIYLYDSRFDQKLNEALSKYKGLGKSGINPAFILVSNLRILARDDPANFGDQSGIYKYVTNNMFYDNIDDIYRNASKKVLKELWLYAIPIITIFYFYKK